MPAINPDFVAQCVSLGYDWSPLLLVALALLLIYSNILEPQEGTTPMTTPTTVRDFHQKVVTVLGGAQDTDEVSLRFPQKLRAAAAGAVFAECRPHFTEEDEDDLGFILGQLAGWVLHGNSYDPGTQPNDGLAALLEGARAAA